MWPKTARTLDGPLKRCHRWKAAEAARTDLKMGDGNCFTRGVKQGCHRTDSRQSLPCLQRREEVTRTVRTARDRNRNVVWEMDEAVFIRNRQNVSIGFGECEKEL